MATSQQQASTRMKVIEEHLRALNAHDVSTLMKEFGKRPQVMVNTRKEETPDAIRSGYEELFNAYPDAHFKLKGRHIADDAIVVEEELSATHKGTWRGHGGTGRHVDVPVCAIFTFDDSDKLTNLKAYFDESALEQ